MVSSYSKTSFSTSRRLAQWPTVLQPFVLELPAMKRHHRLAEAEEKPAPRSCEELEGGCRQHRIVRERQDSAPKPEDIDATSALFDEVAVFNGLHENAPSNRLCQTPLEGCGGRRPCLAISNRFQGANGGDLVREGFKSVGSIPTTMARIARPLSREAPCWKRVLLFDDGKFWHAHEAGRPVERP